MMTSEAAGVNAMAEALIASGSVTREAATQMLAAELGDADASATAEAPQDAMREGVAHDAAGAGDGAGEDARDADGSPRTLADAPIDPLFAPPATPQDYRFEMQPATGMQPEQLRAVQRWCHGARLPQAIAQSLYSEVERGAHAPLTPAQLRAHNAAGLAELRRNWGERTGAMLGLGRRLVTEVGGTHPDLIDFLESSGAGSNPRVVRQLAEHAARMYGNPDTKGGRA